MSVFQEKFSSANWEWITSWVQNDNFWFDFRFSLSLSLSLTSHSSISPFPHDKSCNHYLFSCNIFNPLGISSLSTRKTFWEYTHSDHSLILSPIIRPSIFLFLVAIKEQFSFLILSLLFLKGLLPLFPLSSLLGPWAVRPWVCLSSFKLCESSRYENQH